MKISKNAKISKIFIIRLSSMGDVILTSNTVRCIKATFPNAKLDFLTLNSYKEIFEHNPHIDNLFLYDKNFNSKEFSNFIENILSSGQYDFVIDLQNNHRSKKIANYLSKNILSFNKRRIHKLSLVYLKKAIDKREITIPELYLSTAESLQVLDDGLGLELWTKEDSINDKFLSKELNVDPKKLVIGIAPGAHFQTKRYPEDKIIKLINIIKSKIDAEFYLLGGKEDFDLCETIRKVYPEFITNFAGSESIQKTTKIIDQCNALITNDTGIMHIASARQVPLVAIFGSSVKEFGFTPFRVKNFIIEKELSCRPCSHIGKNKCPKQHFNCMNLIEPIEIANKLLDLIFIDKSEITNL